MKGLVHDVMAVVMTPFMDIFSGQASTTNVVTELMNGIREILAAIYKAFLSFIEPFLLKFTNITYQIGIKTQQLRSAFRKVSAMALSTVFTGLTFIKGIQNAIDFVIKVVMIILIVLVVLIILLFFILLPFLPLILSVIAVIVAVATASVSASAGGMKGTFCFEPSTRVLMATGATVAISELALGDRLYGETTVTGILTLDGSTSPLYSLNGIRVSGSHLVLDAETGWHSVKDDPRAKCLGVTVPVLYCLNTSSHKIPVVGASSSSITGPGVGVGVGVGIGRASVASANEVVWFRDWEEMDNENEEAHREWDAAVSSLLGGISDDGRTIDPFCLMDPGLQVLSYHRGLLRLDEVTLGDVLYLDEGRCRSTVVTGLVSGLTGNANKHHSGWMSSCLVQRSTDKGWTRTTTLGPGTAPLQGAHLITDTGLICLLTPAGPLLVRDMTEIGTNHLHETYGFVLRSLGSAPL